MPIGWGCNGLVGNIYVSIVFHLFMFMLKCKYNINNLLHRNYCYWTIVMLMKANTFGSYFRKLPLEITNGNY